MRTVDRIPEILSRGQGRWKEILINFGIPEEMLNGKHQPCFYCGGKDRARWIPEKDYYFCNVCDTTSRSGITLISEYNNISLNEVINDLANYLGIAKSFTGKDYKKKKRHKQYIRAKTIVAGASGSITRNRKLTDNDLCLMDKAIRYINWYDNKYVRLNNTLHYQ